MLTVLVCLFITFVTEVKGQHSVVKCIPDGTLRGTRIEVGNTYVETYLSIPYASPPVGDLRFKKPVPNSPWTGTRDATELGTQCPQRPSPGAAVILPNDEDCLYLSVYAPKPPPDWSQLPVMVWIHGGGYMTGAGNMFNATQLAARGVVVVTINYRLDALGFLCTEDEVSPGNYALWDMIRALEWVRDSISSFDGNPDDVTIFGESAGSGAVSLLLMSPAAKGLFHKAVMESGVSMGDWAVARPNVDPKPREQAVKLAEKLGCETGDTPAMVECLRGIDAMALINASTDIFMEKIADDMRLQFRPVVETTFGQTKVLPSAPRAVLENGGFNNVTTIRGFNSREYGIFFAPDQGGMTVQEFRERARQFIRLNMAQSSFSFDIDEVTDLLVDAYIVRPNVTDPLERRAAAIELQSDFIFVAPTIYELQQMTKTPVPAQYLYCFSYRSQNRLTKPWQGAVHADDLHYVFGYPVSGDFLFEPFVSGWTEEDIRMSEDIMTLWTNFAKYGNPTPDALQFTTWLPWTSDSSHYLDIGNILTLNLVDEAKFAKVKVMMDIIIKRLHENGSTPPVG